MNLKKAIQFVLGAGLLLFCLIGSVVFIVCHALEGDLIALLPYTFMVSGILGYFLVAE